MVKRKTGDFRKRRSKLKVSKPKDVAKAWIDPPRKKRKGKRIDAILSTLPQVDLTTLNEPCLILDMRLFSDKPARYDDTKLLAWFPTRQYVGVVSNSLLPAKEYVHVASSSGFLCGLHLDNIYNITDLDEWTLRLAVCNPATGFQMELPPLEVCGERDRDPPGQAHLIGTLEVKMTPPLHGEAGDRNRFSVHVAYKRRGCTVFTFNSGTSEAWESSSNDPDAMTGHLAGDIISLRQSMQGYDVKSRSWSAVPSSYESFKKYPLPPEFADYTYRRIDGFLYGSRIIAAGQCRKRVGKEHKVGIVMMEREQDGSWRIFTHVSTSRFDKTVSLLADGCGYLFSQPLQTGKLLVFPADLGLCWPVAFHLEDYVWLETPSEIWPLPIQTNCVYNPVGVEG